MLRLRTIYASSASSTAAYFAEYLADAPGEQPGVWTGQQAAALGLAGTVTVADLELLLCGRDPVSGMRLGREFVDVVKRNGELKRAVAGFEATFSEPKALSVWWGLTGDDRLLDAHDVAVRALLEHVERYASTTRVHVDGRMTVPGQRWADDGHVSPDHLPSRRSPGPYPCGDLVEGADGGWPVVGA